MEQDVQLIHGDCLVEMNNIPDRSIDMILCDLPYGTTACKWDVVLPFYKLWEQYERIIKPNGVIALFGSEPFSTIMRASNMPLYKYDWVWVKSNGSCSGFVHAKNMPLKKHELISIFSKGAMGHKSQLGDKRMTYNPQGLVYNPTKKSSKGKFGSTVGIRPSQVEEYVREYSNYPTSILEFASERGMHPTQKPVSLLEYLINTYTNEGETVLDNTMGSGSTMVACVNTNRKGIGIEKDEKYFEVAKNRVEKALEEKNKPNLFNL